MKNCSLIVRLIGILLVSYIIVGPVESLKFNENGTTVAGGNGYGSNLNELAYPWGLSVDNEMNVYVVDQNNHRVVKWLRQALTGELLWRKNSTNGETIMDGYHQRIMGCNGLFVADDGTVFLSDTDNHRVLKWSSLQNSTIVVAGGNGEGNASNQLDYPMGIYVDEDVSVYIADRSNHRVQKWRRNSSEGITVAGGNGEGSDLNQLYAPESVIVDNDGSVYIADQLNNRLVKWDVGAKEGIIIAGGNGEGKQAN
ncbi:unnamed protein product [Didymodactylos carnosus]|uniref:Uncharacterized protein n=1 Tax=Didymodactylos carnosus TaxID=1234261 RepID=A0A815HD31_9BILA|nr:unnamed protein product [Didymodactylos carnosus]CAF4223740.1 unnamed protein product [Didymodactylos carnosus]